MKTLKFSPFFTPSFLTLVLLFLTQASKAQTATAYAWFTVNSTVGTKDVYVFTSPKAFSYTKGSTYVFSPVQFEKVAKNVIENKLRDYDGSFNGLYVNQISNGTRTTFGGLEKTKKEIEAQMLETYNSEKEKSYRGNEVEIVLIDFEHGTTLSKYSLPATAVNSKKSGAANAY
jgi:hypothetical protein